MTRDLIRILIILISIQCTWQNVDDVIQKRVNHKPLEISEIHKTNLANAADIAKFNEILDNILVERVVGTPSHDEVRDYISNQMKDLNWHVELDEFEDETPFGKHKFANIIAKLNPNAERYLLLACHYDSKFFDDKNKKFLGATDSAVPCTMLINIAHVMKDHFANAKDNDLSIMFVFFDGEEAFVEWTATDSIYGARHLAKKWEDEGFLYKIDVFMLLDLLGSPDPTFYALNPETLTWYQRLSITEDYLSDADLMNRYTTSGVTMRSPNKFFNQYSIHAGIEDDHVPFMRRGVPILHLIPVPFPTVWHKFDDDRSAIDVDTSENLMKVFRIFIAEYLHLDLDK